VTKPPSNAPPKPVLDEESFQQLLAAASVIQEHRKNLQSAESEGNFTLVLSQIVETGGLLQRQKPDLPNASRIIVERCQKATHASGAALGLLKRGQVSYLAAIGVAASDLGSWVAVKSCLGADCFISKQSLKVIAAENSRSPELNTVLQERGLAALIAVPLWCQGAVAGILELRFVTPAACNEGAVRATELFAGLASIVLLSAKQAGGDSDRAELDNVESSSDGESVRFQAPSQPPIPDHLSGAVEVAEKDTGLISPSPSLHSDRLAAKTKSVLSPKIELSEVENDSRRDSGNIALSRDTASSTSAPIRIVPGNEAGAQDLNAQAWTSARKAKQWLDNLKSGQGPSFAWVRQLWKTRRAVIYMAIAGLILVITIAHVGLSSGPSRSAVAVTGKSRRHKVAPLHLTMFEEFLVSLGLAEAPPPPKYQGNPNVQVWVDIHTALYYCPGADLYGKTNGGRFTTQLEAQQDQFEPANREVCD
jgi:hypothetical protein